MPTKKTKAEFKRFDPFHGLKAQSERRAVGFDARKHRETGVSTHLDKRSAGNDALLGERNYQKRLQQKPAKQIEGKKHKETNYFVDRLGVLYKEIIFFNKDSEVQSTSVKRVKEGKVPKTVKQTQSLGLALQETGGISSAPIGTKINIRKGDVTVSSDISGRDRQKLMDLAKKEETKAKETRWYTNFFGLQRKRTEIVEKEIVRAKKSEGRRPEDSERSVAK